MFQHKSNIVKSGVELVPVLIIDLNIKFEQNIQIFTRENTIEKSFNCVFKPMI